jgi:streptogramin lyase
MAIDANLGVLWIAEASGPGIPGSDGLAATSLIQMELSTGHIRRRFTLPADTSGPHQLNDVAVARNHTVFVADAQSGEVYRLAPGADQMELLVPKGTLLSAQGMVVAPDQRALFVADYGTGLHRIDLRTGVVSSLPSRRPAALVGIDGLVACGDSLFATQNGTSPQRILQIHLNPAARAVESVRIVAEGGQGVDDITLRACDAGQLRYISNSQWANYKPDGSPRGSNFASVTIGELPAQH